VLEQQIIEGRGRERKLKEEVLRVREELKCLQEELKLQKKAFSEQLKIKP
jgi:hypothetical protein